MGCTGTGHGGLQRDFARRVVYVGQLLRPSSPPQRGAGRGGAEQVVDIFCRRCGGLGSVRAFTGEAMTPSAPTRADTDEFANFVRDAEPRLRRAMVAAYGNEDGRDAVAEALGYAWEHWERVSIMGNPVGYLYRVARSRGRRRPKPTLPKPTAVALPDIDPGLPAALEALSTRQRAAVLLVHADGWTQQEAADVLGISTSALRSHLERGMRRLRAALEETDHA
jgi:DNA-directed RNA polymerase specialized sigma24 family protein